jgi:putative Mg2+ transporter-C (MgtC) family protein
MACGAGLPLLAIAVTAGHFVVVGVFPAIERRLPKSRWAAASLRVSYYDGRGLLREVLAVCTQQDFAISRLRVGNPGKALSQSGFHSGKGQGKGEDDEETPADVDAPIFPRGKGVVTVLMEIRGVKSMPKLVTRLSEMDGVVGVHVGDVPVSSE